MSFAKEVKETLKKITIDEWVEVKANKFSYLPWAKAWDLLTEIYPESTYKRPETVFIGNGTCEIYSEITVSDGESSLTREVWLPVMNHMNKAIVDPTTRDISDARFRCMVKCIAMFGLGLHLYQGEDVPLEYKSYSDDQYSTYKHYVQIKNGFSLYAMVNAIGEEASNDLYNSAPKGEKTAFKDVVDGLMAQGVDAWNIFETDIITAVEAQDAHQIKTLLDEAELTQMEKQYMANRMSENWKTILSLYKEA